MKNYIKIFVAFLTYTAGLYVYGYHLEVTKKKQEANCRKTRKEEADLCIVNLQDQLETIMNEVKYLTEWDKINQRHQQIRDLNQIYRLL